MSLKARKALVASVVVFAGGVAAAQQLPAGPQPYAPSSDPIGAILTPPTTSYQAPADMEAATLRSALDAAKRGDVTTARSAMLRLADPAARKLVLWAMTDSAGESLSFSEVDQARRELASWPRSGRRQTLAEKALARSGESPQQVIAWFAGAEPTTAEGAIALATAYRATGKSAEASALVKTFWRDRIFEAEAQRQMLARFGDVLSQDDHIRRADIVLYGSQGPAAREMIALLPPEHQQLAQARIALRANANNASDLVAALPAQFSDHPGLAFERAAYFRRRGLSTMALGLVKSFPTEIAFTEMGARIWDERYQLVLASIRAGDAQSAYAAAANSGLTSGGDAADAEFYAGWLALSKLKNPVQADVHFANLEKIGQSPITRGRALYWRGRAAEARGDKAAAGGWYKAAAEYDTTFYGQLAAEKIGQRLQLDPDPTITEADRNRFEGRDTVQAARLLYRIGARDLFKTFVLALDDVLPTAEEQALLVDLARGHGDQDTSMKVVRTAAQRGFILKDRGYPMRTPPQVGNAPEPALVLGITRQESGFDPLVRSSVGARGMMQLMPATAQLTARKAGVNYAPGLLDDPEYNMRLGSSYLGELIGNFSGSYVMAIAGYNAGPGRPRSWVEFCGDPRTSSADPIDFIECIPFSETRNYVMRVMEGMVVYRAKLAGGSAPITLASDLKRGGYGGYRPVTEARADPLPIGGSNAPIPNP